MTTTETAPSKNRDEGERSGNESTSAENSTKEEASNDLVEIEYLSGLKLWLILIALLLAMFLVALDMVNQSTKPDRATLIPFIEYHLNGYSKDHGRFQKFRSGWVVRFGFLHDFGSICSVLGQSIQTPSPEGIVYGVYCDL